jgi:type I restriction enzyme S subunit
MRLNAEDLPLDWKLVLLDGVTVRGSGHTPNKNFPSYWNGGVKWVSLADSNKLDNGYIYETDKEISHEGLRHSSAVLHRKGSVILSRDAGVGKSAVLGDEMAVSQHFIAWRCNGHNQIHNWYLYYWLQYWKPEFERIAIGSTIKTIGLPYFKKLKAPFPPYAEQVRIASAIAHWDKAIATVEQLIANSRAQKKALMQQLLSGRKRLPGFSGKWEFKSINQIAKRIQRKVDDKEHPILTISSLSGFVTQEEKYSRYMAGESVKNYVLLKKGEFAYNKGNSKTYQFGCVFDLETFETGLVPHVYVCFKLNKGLSHRFYKYLFEADYLKPQLGGLVNTGVRNNGLLNIKPSEFLKTKVPVPSFEEQEKIADLIHVANEEVSNLEKQLGDCIFRPIVNTHSGRT